MFLKVLIGDSMRKFQNLFAFGMLAVAAVLFAGCGSADSGTGGDSGDSGSGTTATSDEGGEAGGGEFVVIAKF